MSPLLIPVAAYLLLYAPGHFLLRGAGDGQERGSRLFREVLLSACCTSYLGFVLAEIGLYSLPALLISQAVISAVAALWRRRRPPWAYNRTDLAGLGVAAISWLWLSPPLDTHLLGSDSAGYLAAGVHLSRHGSLVMRDPTLQLLSPDLKRGLFPTVTTTPGAPPYLRLPGSLILRGMDTDEVLPAFHHLITVWIAAFHGLAGSAATPWAITLFGGLSVWAMVQFAAAVSGGWAAAAFLVLLSLSAIQSWYSRFLMPEIPAQFFVWGGLACLSFWSTAHRRSDAALAGLAFGIAGLVRTENAAFLFVALALGLVQGEGFRTQRLLLFACAALVWTHAAAHLIHFRTHYEGILRSLLPETVAIFSGAPWPRIAVLAALVAVIGTLLLWRIRRGSSALQSMLPVTLLATAVSLWGEWQHGWTGTSLLAAYIGVPTLIAGGAGLLVWAKQVRRSNLAGCVFCTLAALAFVQFMLAPNATPVPIWVARRAATIVVPALCLGVVFLCQTAAQRLHWSIAAAVFCFAVAAQAGPFAQLRWTPYYRGSLHHIEAVGAMLPPGACVFFDAPLTAWGFAPALWADRDLPGYLLSRYDGKRIAQMLRALNGMPVYWIGESRAPPPRVPGFTAIRIGSHAVTVLTPTLDTRTEPGSSSLWNRTVVVYSFKPEGRREDAR
ncbi:hypothetical protein L6Q96_13065 [Candidatus Binatia bacterium]|nr:hypothetical protein [Candidatus Binatia bacterium]